MAEFRVTPVTRGTTTFLQVSGELDIATAPTFSEAARVAFAAAARLVVVDLSETSFLDSTGCRSIARLVRTARSASAEVCTVCPMVNVNMWRVIEIVGLPAAMPVYRTLDEVPTADDVSS